MCGKSHQLLPWWWEFFFSHCPPLAAAGDVREEEQGRQCHKRAKCNGQDATPSGEAPSTRQLAQTPEPTQLSLLLFILLFHLALPPQIFPPKFSMEWREQEAAKNMSYYLLGIHWDHCMRTMITEKLFILYQTITVLSGTFPQNWRNTRELTSPPPSTVTKPQLANGSHQSEVMLFISSNNLWWTTTFL